jgi:hypothetical protein
LILSRRSIQYEIGRWNVERSADDFNRLVAIPVNVEVHVANFFQALFGPAVCAVPDWIHSNKDVSPSPILFEQYGLKFGRRNVLCFGDALEGMAQASLANENGNAIGRRKESEHVLRGGQ